MWDTSTAKKNGYIIQRKEGADKQGGRMAFMPRGDLDPGREGRGRRELVPWSRTRA